MSGLEIAGVMLAAPPLAVSWLEHYREIFEACGCWRKFRAEYRKCQTQVQMLELSIDMTLEKGFLPFVDSHQELQRLKKTPDDQARAEVESRLRRRLIQEVQSAYTSSLKDLKEAMTGLQHVLSHQSSQLQAKLDVSSQNLSTNPKQLSLFEKIQMNTVYEVERVKFSTRAKPREAAFQRVEHQLEALRKVLLQNDEIVELRASETRKSRPKNVGALIHFWRHAQVAYDLIAKSWCCTCRLEHCADLRLSEGLAPTVRLDVDFVFTQTEAIQRHRPWSRLETRIKREDPNDGRKRVVSFAASSAPREPAALSSIVQPVSIARISDLCLAMSTLNAADNRIGLLAYQQHQYCLYMNAGEESVTKTENFVSLRSLLDGNNPQKPERRQRFGIALTLVSSHLQIHPSAWLESGWSTDNIFFSSSKGKP